MEQERSEEVLQQMYIHIYGGGNYVCDCQDVI